MKDFEKKEIIEKLEKLERIKDDVEKMASFLSSLLEVINMHKECKEIGIDEIIKKYPFELYKNEENFYKILFVTCESSLLSFDYYYSKNKDKFECEVK